MRDLGPTSQLQTLMTAVVTDMEYPGRSIDRDLSQKLSRQLLGKVKSYWQADQPLTLITDGFLANVPFVSLVDEHGLLIHLTALSANLKPQKHRNHNPRTLLAVGVDGADKIDSITNNHSNNDLRFAEEEARSIASIWPEQDVTLLLGENAHWDAIGKSVPGRAWTIHQKYPTS